MYDVVTGAHTRLAEDSLDRDGHPSVMPGGDAILTATYPDTCGDQKLLLYRESEGTRCLGRYLAPARF